VQGWAWNRESGFSLSLYLRVYGFQRVRILVTEARRTGDVEGRKRGAWAFVDIRCFGYVGSLMWLRFSAE